MIIRVVQSRHVMLPVEVLDLLRQWWKERPTEHDAASRWRSAGCFPAAEHRPLTARHFGRLFKEAAAAAGIRKSVTLHTARHSFATTHLLERGTDVRVIQALTTSWRRRRTEHASEV